MLDEQKLSSRYRVRRLGDADADEILRLCEANTQFYAYCQAQPTKAQVLSDLRLLPPGVAPGDKYYLGFYQGETLIAVMDLVDGYPVQSTVFLGFFMLKKELQGQGLGTAIIGETAAYLNAIGKTAVRLAIDKDNPQSNHFWKKNGFHVLQEVERAGWTVLVAEKAL